MKEQLEQKSIELLGWLEQAIKTTSEFGTERLSAHTEGASAPLRKH